MAMQTYVFFKKEKIPTSETLQAKILEEGFDYQLPEDFNITNAEGDFIQGKFEGLESCFDYALEDYDAEEWEWNEQDVKLLDSPDIISVFNTFSNAQEITAMLVVSSALTKLTEGVMYSDFFEDELITKNDCVEFAKEIIENSREQFSGPSKMRG